mgnify:CR=1 FL=1
MTFAGNINYRRRVTAYLNQQTSKVCQIVRLQSCCCWVCAHIFLLNDAPSLLSSSETAPATLFSRLHLYPSCEQIVHEYSLVPKEVQGFSAADKKEFAVLHAAKIQDIKHQMSR